MPRKLLLCAMALSVMSTPILASNGNSKIILSKKEENTLACVKKQILNSKSVDKEFNNFTLNDWKQRSKQNRFIVQKTLEKLHKNECADIDEALNRSVNELKTKVAEKSGTGYFGIIDENQVKNDSYAIISGYQLDVAVLGKKVTEIFDNGYSLSGENDRYGPNYKSKSINSVSKIEDKNYFAEKNGNDSEYRTGIGSKIQKYNKDDSTDRENLNKKSVVDSENTKYRLGTTSNRDIPTKGISSDFTNEGYRYSKANPTARERDSILKGKYNGANNPESYGRSYDSKYKSTFEKDGKDINRNKDNSQLSIETQSIYKNKKDNPFNHDYSKDTQSFKSMEENISHSDRFSRANITSNANYNQSKENVPYQDKYSKDNQPLGNTRDSFLYSDEFSKSSETRNINNNQSRYSNKNNAQYNYKNDKKSNEELNEQLKIINDDLDKASMKEGWGRENK